MQKNKLYREKLSSKKNNRYKKIFNKNFNDSKKFIIFDIYIDIINFNTIKLIVKRLFLFSLTNIWILNSNTIFYCSNNKILFKNLKLTNDVARIINDKIIRIEIINNISIQLINKKTLILSNIRYISKLIINLINILNLYYRKFNFTYSIKSFCNIFNKSYLVN